MSWQSINDLLCKAALDQRFAKVLLADPSRAVREGGFELTAEELSILLKVRAESVAELSDLLLTQFTSNER